MSKGTYKVGLKTYKIVGYVCFVLFIGASVGAFIAKQYQPIIILAIFALLGLYMILAAGEFEFDENAVTHQCVLSSARMHWNEVKEIEYSRNGTFVLHGIDKRFVISPPSSWSGGDRKLAYDLFRSKVEALGIVPYVSNTADYKTNKNVKFQRVVK